MSEAIKKAANLREGVRPKMIDMWALRYCDKLAKDGKEGALAWGNSFFNKEDLQAIAKRAKEILRGRGLM